MGSMVMAAVPPELATNMAENQQETSFTGTPHTIDEPSVEPFTGTPHTIDESSVEPFTGTPHRIDLEEMD